MGAVRSARIRKVPARAPVRSSTPGVWQFAAVFGAALVLTLWVYGPALNGPFLFDDMALPYAVPARATLPIEAWVTTVRPLLYFSFWLNYMASGSETLSYHLVNLVLHALNCALVFIVVRRLLVLSKIADRAIRVLAPLAAGLFLLHPLQTESVAYIASRSETLSAFFMLAALAVFANRMPGRITWRAALSILLLFAAACASKEEGAALIPMLLVTDSLWNAGFPGIRRNWRLYLPLAAITALPAAVAWSILSKSMSAGFNLPDFTWYQYFYTQCRAVFAYIRLFVAPLGQTVDHDFPASKSIFDHGSIYGLLGLIAVIGLAFFLRRRYRLACYGALLFLIVLAPSSSFVPLRDTFAEHRMYLPMFGLILIVLEFAARIRPQKILIAAGAAVLVFCALVTYNRSQVWGDPVLLWQDAMVKAPTHARPYDSLAMVYITQRRCREAAGVLETVSQRFHPMPYYSLVMWSEAEDCLSHYGRSADLIAKAAEMHPDPQFYLRLGLMRAKQGASQESLDAFNKAIALNGSFGQAYAFRGRWYEAAGRGDLAAQDYRRALEVDPNNAIARRLLDQIERRTGK